MSEPAGECHAVTRARERYGLELTAGDLKEIESGIAGGTPVLMPRRSAGKRVHIVRFKGLAARVVASPVGTAV